MLIVEIQASENTSGLGRCMSRHACENLRACILLRMPAALQSGANLIAKLVSTLFLAMVFDVMMLGSIIIQG